MQERRGVSFRRLSWLAALLAVLTAAGAYVAYVQLLHYRRCAAEHLPPSTVFAARLDVEQVILFDPVRRHLLPLVEVLPPAGAQQAPGEAEARLAQLRAAGLNLGLDLREILVASTAERGWLVALGGLFPRAGAVRAIAQVLHDENVSGWQQRGERIELAPSGAVLEQAADGVLLVASDAATLDAALPKSTRYLQLGLAREGAGGAAASPEAARAAGYPGPDEWLSGVRGVVAQLQLAGDVELAIEVKLADPAQAQLLATRARQWLQIAPGAEDRQAGKTDPLGLWARTRAVESSESSVKLTSSWRASELDRSARELAAWIRRQLPASERAGN